MAKKIIKKYTDNTIGAWAFLIGVVAAVTLGAFSAQIVGQTQNIVLWSLIIIGFIVGLLNITNKETDKFLFAGLTLVIVSYMGRGVLVIIPQLSNVLSALLILFIPTTIIVALKSVFKMAKD